MIRLMNYSGPHCRRLSIAFEFGRHGITVEIHMRPEL